MIDEHGMLKLNPIRLFVIFSFICINATLAQIIDGGVHFKSFETTKDLRTGLDLTPFEPIAVDEDLEMEFDLRFWQEDSEFGYIFRLIGENGDKIDLICSPRNNEEFSGITLVVDGSTSNIYYRWNEIPNSYREWIHCKLKFDNSKGIVDLSIGDKAKSTPLPFNQSDYFIVFGKSILNGIKTTDVPRMEVKDIRISSNGETVRHWPLIKHSNEISYDEINDFPMKIYSGEWLIDDNIYWKNLQKISFNERPQVVFDGDETLYFLTSKELVSYDLSSGEQSKNMITNTRRLPQGQQSLYHPVSHQIYTYDLTKLIIHKFDINALSWLGTNPEFDEEPTFWHANKLMNNEGKAIFFGGYGFHKYKNRLVGFYDSLFTNVNISAIEPRYLASAGWLNDEKILLFGGYGSKSGNQIDGPMAFHEAFLIDLQTMDASILFESTPSFEDQVQSNSLVLSESDSSFFVLSFPKEKYEASVWLERYDFTTGEKTSYDDSLTFKFSDIHSFADLYLDKSNNRLISILLEKEDGDNYLTNIYGLNYPPLQKETAFQSPPQKKDYRFWIMAFIAVFIVLAFVFRKKLKKQPAIQNIPKHPPLASVSSSYRTPQGDIKGSILLMGTFQVIDKDGQDISDKFSATLKLLFCLILLHSSNKRKGVSSNMIWEEVWGDKSETKARNNRNVNINKLRGLLDSVGDIKIVSHGDRWALELGEDVFCDYQYIMNASEDKITMDPELILEIAEKGNILRDLESEWLDEFKANLSLKAIDALVKLNENFELDYKQQIKLANAILKFDMINQDGLIIKCRALNNSGKFALAKECYEQFIHEYAHMYGEPFQLSFESIISDKSK